MSKDLVEAFKKRLSRAIVEVITEREYTYSEAAALAGTHGAIISQACNPKHLDKFKVDRLIQIAAAVGCKVELTVSRKWART